MVLTPLAESLAQPVRSCLMQIQHTVASKAEFNPAASDRKFCLAVSDYVTAVLMPQAMPEAVRLAPGVRFELVRLDESIKQKLEKGEIDFFVRPSVSVTTDPSRRNHSWRILAQCRVAPELSDWKQGISPKPVFRNGSYRRPFRTCSGHF